MRWLILTLLLASCASHDPAYMAAYRSCVHTQMERFPPSAMRSLGIEVDYFRGCSSWAHRVTGR